MTHPATHRDSAAVAVFNVTAGARHAYSARLNHDLDDALARLAGLLHEIAAVYGKRTAQ